MAQTQKSRRETLEQFVAEKPSDAFARYGLALECVKLGDDAAATRHLLEMYRRQLFDDKSGRRLQRLDRRLLDIDQQLQNIAVTEK